MTLGEKIKFARQLKGMTQKELGLMVGFSESTADNRIRQYEMGKMKPKEDKLELIANALGVDIDALTDIGQDSQPLRLLLVKSGLFRSLRYGACAPHRTSLSPPPERWWGIVPLLYRRTVR